MCSKINDIDRILVKYYMIHNITNYQNTEGVGKFKIFCEDNGIDDDALADEFDDIDTFLVEFDDEFPFFDNPTSKQKNKRIHAILKHIYYNNACPLSTHTFIPSDEISIDDYQNKPMPKYKIQLSSDCFAELLSFLPTPDIFRILYGNIVKTKRWPSNTSPVWPANTVQCWNICIKFTDNNIMNFWNQIDFRRIFAYIYGEYLEKVNDYEYGENQETFEDQEWIGHIKDYERVRKCRYRNEESYLNCIDIDLTNTNLQNILSYDRIQSSKNDILVVKHTYSRTQTYFKLNDLTFNWKEAREEDSKDYTFGEIRSKNKLPFGICGDQVSDNRKVRKLYPMHLWTAAANCVANSCDDGYWLLFCLLNNSNCLRKTNEIVIRFSVAFWIGHYYSKSNYHGGNFFDE